MRWLAFLDGMFRWYPDFSGSLTELPLRDFVTFTFAVLFLFMFFFIYFLIDWKEISIRYVWCLLLFVFQISTQIVYMFSNYFTQSKCCVSCGFECRECCFSCPTLYFSVARYTFTTNTGYNDCNMSHGPYYNRWVLHLFCCFIFHIYFPLFWYGAS